MLNQEYKLGLRAVKTAIAVFFCLLISVVFSRSDALIASIAAIICMQQTYNKTYNTGLHRLIGTMIGGAIGYLFLLGVQYVPHKDYVSIVVAPISILVVIYICNFINRKDSIVIGCIVVLSVVVQFDYTDGNTLMYVINRVIDTCIGIVVAMIINRFCFAKHSKKIIESNIEKSIKGNKNG